MFGTISIPAGADVVLSSGEHGFKAVLDDLPNSATVDVLTFSLSGKGQAGQLLTKLRRLPSTVSLRIITNIPSSYDRTVRRIEEYKRLLDPTRFRPKLQAYYNLSNHAKVVATQNVAYIGSANFSHPDSLECGLLLRGEWVVGPIVKDIFAAAMAGAKPHPRTEAEVRGVWMRAAIARLRTHSVTVNTLADRLAGKTEPFPDLLAEESGEKLLAECDDLADTLSAIAFAVEEEHQRMHLLNLTAAPFRRLRERFMSDALRELLAHDGQRYIQAVAAHDTGPYADAVSMRAVNAEAEHRGELLAAAANELTALEEQFVEVEKLLERACSTLDALEPPPGPADAVLR